MESESPKTGGGVQSMLGLSNSRMVNTGPRSISPYMNFDPSIVNMNPESQFILPEGASARRGRFEMAFAQIGGSVFAGAFIGGVNGLSSGYKTIPDTAKIGSLAAKRTHIVNAVAKQGASYAQSLGSIALFYSLFGWGLSFARGAEDELNTLAAGTATGMIYKCNAGMQKSLRGGAVGLGLASLYCLISSRDRIKQYLNID